MEKILISIKVLIIMIVYINKSNADFIDTAKDAANSAKCVTQVNFDDVYNKCVKTAPEGWTTETNVEKQTCCTANSVDKCLFDSAKTVCSEAEYESVVRVKNLADKQTGTKCELYREMPAMCGTAEYINKSNADKELDIDRANSKKCWSHIDFVNVHHKCIDTANEALSRDTNVEKYSCCSTNNIGKCLVYTAKTLCSKEEYESALRLKIMTDKMMGNQCALYREKPALCGTTLTASPLHPILIIILISVLVFTRIS